ncbi:hypothetical protein J6590_002058 [Homalodisca vitripennis]|nr:hypothetical protein J6590_002058 [Homalodisca vitripennis]
MLSERPGGATATDNRSINARSVHSNVPVFWLQELCGRESSVRGMIDSGLHLGSILHSALKFRT